MFVSTGVVKNIQFNNAEVSGQVIDLGSGATGYGFCYAQRSGVTVADSIIQLGVPPGAGNFTSQLSNLEAGTKYYIKAYLTDGIETVYGKEISFTTIAAYVKSLPSATAYAATKVANTTAKVNGAVIANDYNTVVIFEYGSPDLYSYAIYATPNMVIGIYLTMVSAELTELTPGTLFHFRVKAVNEIGTNYSNEHIFTTLQIPSAVTTAATNIMKTTVTLNGSVNAFNASASVTFEYGLNDSYGSTATADQNPVNGSILTDVSAGINGLTKGMIYHFRVKAQNYSGCSYGEDKTFTTPE